MHSYKEVMKGFITMSITEQEHKKNEPETEISQTKRKRKIKPVYIVVTILALAAIGIITYMLWPESKNESGSRETVTGGRGIILTADNIDEVRDIMNRPNPDAQFTVSMTTNWIFDTWDTPSQRASVSNLKYNPRTVYFDVTLNDTNELVYSSPYIPLGETLYNFALDTNPGIGTHNATVRYFLVDDDFQVVADLAVSVVLTLEN